MVKSAYAFSKKDFLGGCTAFMKWQARSEALARERGVRITLDLDARPASVADVLQAWQDQADFRTLFNALLAETPYEAFRWETPAVTIATLSRPFECVLLNAPGLARHPNQAAFAEHFTRAKEGIVVFTNLGGDATLVVPCPVSEPSAYGHLAAFARFAPEAQRHALWQAVGAAMVERVGRKPVWLSTAGAGVSWLHVRLDDRPKYYGYEGYR